jgi:CBS domain containing-hemolysin-like protein
MGIVDFVKKRLLQRTHPESEDEIKEFIKMGEEGGLITEDEEMMLEGVFELGDKEIGEIMVPRVEMVTSNAQKTVQDVRNLMVLSGFSRIPIWYESIDDIVGVAHAKDILRFKGKPRDTSIVELVRLVYFIHETKPVVEAMKELKSAHVSIAIVTDEYADVCGLVTIEDIVEEIVGELQDEFDRDVFLHKRLKDGSFLLNARIEVGKFNELLGTNFEEDVNTLAGLLCTRLERIPTKGETFVIDGVHFKIISATDQKIYKVIVKKGS